jgi:two-component system, response regulator PdtaR
VIKKNARILIIEDDPVTAQFLKKLLENMLYRVIDIIPTGEEAIEKAGALQPDLIIMDITLSGIIDGIEAAMRINERCLIPIIYLTASTDCNVLQRARDSKRCYGCLLKPVTGTDLHWTISMALKRHHIETRP